ncbi:MAG: zinc-binding dehydrogenase [Acidiferrobacterales bacterium]
MRAAYLIEPGKIKIREVPEPTPGPGELVIRVECALTCGTDLKAYQRGHPLIPMPGPFGHQYAGSLSSVGEGVSEFEADMPIWGVHSGPCGECQYCRKTRYNLCPYLQQQMAFGAFGQFLRLPARVARHNVLPRPVGMPAERAAFLEPVSCVVHALAQIDWRGVERVLLIGLGSMGLLFCQLLPQVTKAKVVAIGRNAQRVAMARGGALEQVIEVTSGGVNGTISDAGPFDCVIECTGREDGWRSAFEWVMPGGQVLFFGGLPGNTTFSIDTYKLHYQELRLLGAFHFGPTDVRNAAQLLEQGSLRVADLISGRLPLDQLDVGLQQMEAGSGIKYAIDPWA